MGARFVIDRTYFCAPISRFSSRIHSCLDFTDGEVCGCINDKRLVPENVERTSLHVTFLCNCKVHSTRRPATRGAPAGDSCGRGLLQSLRHMKNIQVIDGASNSVYDIFSATDDEFALVFPDCQDIAFIDEVLARGPDQELGEAFARIWERRIPKREAMGIHGLLFYQLEHKKQYYPTRRDEEAVNPNGTRLR